MGQTAISPSATCDLRSRCARGANVIFLIAIYFIVAAASFNGFFDKWNFLDDSVRTSLVTVLEGRAERPVVYRQLLPDIANHIDSWLSPTLKTRIQAGLHRSDGQLKTQIRSTAAQNPQFIIRYHVIYYLEFLFLFSSLFVLREICGLLAINPIAATLAPLVLALLLPIFQTEGGYYYDFSELFFMAAAAWLCLTGRVWAIFPLIPLTVLATWNKESFLLFLPALYPFLRKNFRPPVAAMVIVSCMATAAATFEYIRIRFEHNPGSGGVEFHLLHLFKFILYYLNPKVLFGLEVNYGIVMAKGSALLTMALIAMIAIRGWRELPNSATRHILIAAAINLPLYFFFANPGEIRNLSMLYLGLVLLAGASLSRWIATIHAPSS